MAGEWTGSAISDCQICSRPVGKSFVDGRTKGGPWAIMCIDCHDQCGVGLGLGCGQKYNTETLLKVAG